MDSQKLTSTLVQSDFEDLLNKMQALFPREAILNKESLDHSKVKLLFGVMQNDKWTQKEYNEVMKKFIRTHKRNIWMPADLIELLIEYRQENGMVM